MTTPSILDQILAKKREEVAALKVQLPVAARLLGGSGVHPAPSKNSLAAALRRPTGAPVRVLAEIKRASPSAGPIRPDADAAAIAREYADAGASAISVVTDRTFFGGHPSMLAAARRAVSLPILRKDFVIDNDQLVESTWLGADAILLIVAALSTIELQLLLSAAHTFGLETLVEVHSLAELDSVLAAPRGPKLIGVNHRDLHTFAIDMSLTETIAKRVPPDVVLVAESGIRTRDDVRRLGDAGAHAVLVGEHLMRAPSPGAALEELLA